MSRELNRVVLVAENCSRRMGGEAILPFHYFRLLRARAVDVHLVVHARVRSELSELFPCDEERIHYVPDQALQKIFHTLGKFLPHRVAEATFGLANQLLTQRTQRAVVQSLVVPGTVVHQPIPVSPRFPSLIYNVGAPVVLGPMNGGMQSPPAFQSAESLLSRLALRLGRSLANLGNRLLPGKLQAARVLVANDRTRAALPAPLQGSVVQVVENGVDLSEWAPPACGNARSSYRFLFIGRLVDWKALDLVLRALLLTPDAELDVIGDGPMLTPWQTLTETFDLSARVRFLGWKTQAECAQHLAQSVALVLPSLYECGGAVVLEAMAMQRPVIATAWGGPADYLDATCGILIDPVGRTEMIEGLADAMRRLLTDPQLACELGKAGRRRLLLQFDWHRKIDRMLEIYRSALR